MTRARIVIVGGGIGGLTPALDLARGLAAREDMAAT